MGLVSIDLLEDVSAKKLVLDAASSAVLLRCRLLSALVEELTEPVKRNINNYTEIMSPIGTLTPMLIIQSIAISHVSQNPSHTADGTVVLLLTDDRD